MTNIELLNRQELIIFLEQSLKVALFQEHKSKNYVRLLGKISCRAYKILMSDDDELEQIYPKIAANINQDHQIFEYQAQLKDLILTKPPETNIILALAISTLILFAIGIMLKMLDRLNIPLIKGLCATLSILILISASVALIFLVYKIVELLWNYFERVQEKPNNLRNSIEKPRQAALKKKKLLNELDQRIKKDIFQFDNQTPEAKSYLLEWNKEMKELSFLSLACYSNLCSMNQAYHKAQVIDRTFDNCLHNKNFSLNSTSQIRSKNDSKDNNLSKITSPACLDICHMNQRLADLGKNASRKIDLSAELEQKKVKNSFLTT